MSKAGGNRSVGALHRPVNSLLAHSQKAENNMALKIRVLVDLVDYVCETREACRNLRLSTQTLVANMSVCPASDARMMIPVGHVKPHRNAGKDASGGGLRATYTHATEHLQGSLPQHMHGYRIRLNGCALRLRIREFSAPNSTPAPAASRVCTTITPELLAGTDTPA